MNKNVYGICCFVCLIGLLLSACQQPAPKKLNKPKAATALPTEPSKEDQAVDKVMNLPEMKQASSEIEKGSKGKNHLAAYVETQPTATEPYYWVKVGEDNGGSIVAAYMFTVNSKTSEIKYYDMVRDTSITLMKWRKDKAEHD